MKNLFYLLTVMVVMYCVSCQGKLPSKPNIIIINVDDMGWRDVGFMGTGFYETPNIDHLSRQGMIFTNGYASASNCAPSRACLMTGRWTPRHGIYTVASSERGESRFRKLIPVENTVTLSRDLPVIPAILKAKGYSTCHAGKWHLSENPLDYGFDMNIGGGHNGHPRSYYPPYGNVYIETLEEKYLTDLIMEKTIAYIDTVSQPFFLYYAPYAVHTPIQPVVEFKRKYEGKPSWNRQNNVDYATMIENLDRNIGLMIAELENNGFLESTFMVFTSDNGGLFGITYQYPLRAGKGSYYEGGIREPFFFVWEGKIAPNSSSDLPITNLDIFPTVLECAGINLNNYQYDGRSLLPIFKGEILEMERPLFWHFPVYLQAYDVHHNENRDSLFRTRPGSVVRYGDWKLHHYFEDDGLELYNLKDDVGEKNNVVEKFPDKTKELSEMLDAWRKETGAPIPTEPNPDYEFN
jgi:arylsulfatase A-like enzyme